MDVAIPPIFAMNLLELFLLAAIWGASFLFMRVATPELGPIALIALRVGIATLVLLPVLRTAQARGHFRSRLRHLFIVGLANSARVWRPWRVPATPICKAP